MAFVGHGRMCVLRRSRFIPLEVREEWAGETCYLSDWQKRFTAVQVAVASNEDKPPSASNVHQAVLNMKSAATLKTPSKRSTDDFYGEASWSFSPYESKFPMDGSVHLSDSDEMTSIIGAMDTALADTSSLLASSNEHAQTQFDTIGQQIHQVFGGMADLRSSLGSQDPTSQLPAATVWGSLHALDARTLGYQKPAAANDGSVELMKGWVDALGTNLGKLTTVVNEAKTSLLRY